MKFLVDAQLPRRLAKWLSDQGHDALHTFDLPLQNQTPDAEINRISLDEERVVITKDSDFVDSFLLGKGPYKLLLVSTGNITNSELLVLFGRSFEQVIASCAEYHFVEINQSTVTIHT